MKKFFETLAVFMANVLKLKPVAWAKCKEDAEIMRWACDKFQSSQVEIDGKPVNVTAPQSPFGYFSDAALNALGFVVAVWIITQVITGFFAMLPYLLAIAVVLWALGLLPKAKGPVPAT